MATNKMNAFSLKLDYEKDIKIGYVRNGEYVNVYLIDTYTDKNGEIRESSLQIIPAFPTSKDKKHDLRKVLKAMAGYYRGKDGK